MVVDNLQIAARYDRAEAERKVGQVYHRAKSLSASKCAQC